MTRGGPTRAALRVGDRVRLDGEGHSVVGLSGTSVRLLGPTGATSVMSMTHLLTVAEFEAPGTGSPFSVTGLGLLDGVSAEARERARWWQVHVVEVETGRRACERDGQDQPVRPEYDPGSTTLQERENAKAAELTALGVSVSARTIRRRRQAYASRGLWGLVDHRRTRGSSPTGRTDSRVLEAIQAARVEQTDTSTGTRGRLRRRAAQLLAQRADAQELALPSRSTFYRLLAALDAGEHTFGAATTRRSLAGRPARPFGLHAALRPGEWVQIDTTALDVMALLEDGVPARVELTMMVDQATRTICAGVLRPPGTKAVDAALLLARATVPEPVRPGWPDALRMRASRLPHLQLAAVDDRMRDAAAKPVILPETIVCDHGKTYHHSEAFQSACLRLGISIDPARPGTGTDKPLVERGFGSVNTLFCQYVAGYTGRDPTRRGEHVEAVWTIEELQELFDQWVVAGWQPRPHEGLRHPEIPRTALSPNEMYAALVAAAGYLPVPLSGEDYLELLPVAWRRVGEQGITRDVLRYDGAALNPYRRQRSPWAARDGKWPVHFDPYDLTRVWLRGATDARDAQDHTWVEVPWIHRDRVPGPFADFTLRHVRAQIAGRGSDPDHETAVADALDALLSRAQTPPSGGEQNPTAGQTSETATATYRDKTTRRVAARTRAGAASHRPPLSISSPSRHDAPPDPDREDRDDVSDTDMTEQDEPVDLDTVATFGLFDAQEQARRYW